MRLTRTRRGTTRSAAALFLHGVAETVADRWWDKLSVVGDASGALGIVMDHAVNDGATWNTWLDAAHADMRREPPCRPGAGVASAAAPVSRLHFAPSPAVRTAATAARDAALGSFASGLQTTVLDFTDFGKGAVKRLGLSPDAFCQMAVQVAYTRMHGTPTAAYESCSMRRFWRGRTETIRSLTAEAAALAAAVAGGRPRDECAALLRAAAAAHTALSRAAAEGRGIDRHLLSLRMEAEQHGVAAGAAGTELFTDALFARSSSWVLSTSNVTSPWLAFFGFGAVCPEGYGIGYQTFEDNFPITVTAWRGHGTDSDAMAGAAAAALGDLRRLLL